MWQLLIVGLGDGYNSQATFIAVFVIASVWVLGLVSLLTWAGHCSIKQIKMNKWLLKLMRVMATLSVTVFFLPITTLLLRGAVCHTTTQNSWHGTSITCLSSAHIALIAACITLALLFVATSMMISIVMIDRNPLSAQLASRVTGRLDLALICCKTVLVVVFSLFVRQLSVSVVILLLAAVGVVWLVLFFKLLPHIVPWMNQFKIGGAAIYCWVVLCLVVAQVLHVDVGVCVVFGAPVAGLCAALVAHAHVIGITQSKLQDLRSAPHLVLWARVHLQRALGKRSHLMTDDDDGVSSQQRTEAEGFKSALALAEQGYRHAVKRAPASGIVQLQLAEFYRIAHKYSFTEIAALQKAAHASSALDIQFFVYQRSRQLQEASESASNDPTPGKAQHSMPSIDQVSFDQHAADADNARLAYYKKQSDLFSALSEVQPDFQQVEELGHALAQLRRKMTTHYTAMILLNDTSVKVGLAALWRVFCAPVTTVIYRFVLSFTPSLAGAAIVCTVSG